VLSSLAQRRASLDVQCSFPTTVPHVCPSSKHSHRSSNLRAPDGERQVLIRFDMGHDENFCGDRLRMTAFLRVVESVPERPSRFRRRLPEKNDEHQTGRSDITDGPSKFGTLAVGPATLSCPSSAGTTDPERSQEDSMHTPVSGTNDPAILPDDGQDPEESLALSEVRSTATGSQSLLQNGNNEWDSTTLHSPSKRVSVYASSAKKTDARANRASDTRKRRLPVNELPLVRTTTEDGLPDRSVGERSH
jgi:hypothetical protein